MWGRLSVLLVTCVLSLVPAGAFAVCDPSCSTCSGATANDCTSCPAGAWLNGNPGPCVTCTDIAFCTSTETCTSSTTSQCTSCASTHYLQNGTADSCPSCTDITNCASAETCTSASNSQCAVC